MQIRKMQQKDLDSVLKWRNHPNTRQNMLNQHEISREEHCHWFERASIDDSRALLIVEDGDQVLGCVIFTGVHPNKTADWSFYTVPNSPKGTGKKVCSKALEYIFETTEVHKVSGQVLDFNIASIKTHERLGFIQEGKLRQQIKVDNIYHDLYLYGLLSEEWKKSIE